MRRKRLEEKVIWQQSLEIISVTVALGIAIFDFWPFITMLPLGR